MPTDDIDTLSGPELSAAVAREVMGWEPQDTEYGMHWWDSCGAWKCDRSDWRPHADRNDAHRVLMRCEDLGIKWTVFANLYAIAAEAGIVSDAGWFMLTVNPAEVCRAALRAVRASR